MIDEDIVRIESTIQASTGKARCRMLWGDLDVVLEPEVALNTARDLMAAATRAETDIAIIRVLRDRVGMGTQPIGVMLRDIRIAREMPALKVALRIEAVAGASTDQPYVHIGRGSLSGSLSPDRARTMATDWIAAAVASQIDVRLRYVLGEYDQLTPDDIENVFTGIRAAAGPSNPDRTT